MEVSDALSHHVSDILEELKKNFPKNDYYLSFVSNAIPGGLNFNSQNFSEKTGNVEF